MCSSLVIYNFSSNSVLFNMSWFDTSGFANIAKSALKGAQRTIDKALDIRDDLTSAPANTPVDTNSDDFFSSWGVSGSHDNIESHNTSTVTESPQKITSVTSTSLWGSFAGSFFETPKEKTRSKDDDSLDDAIELGTEHFNTSKLVVQHSDDGDMSVLFCDDKDVMKKFEESLLVEVPLGEYNMFVTVMNYKTPLIPFTLGKSLF